MSRSGTSTYARALKGSNKEIFGSTTTTTKGSCSTTSRNSCSSVDLVGCLVHSRNLLSIKQQRSSKKVHCINLQAPISCEVSSCHNIHNSQELSPSSCGRACERLYKVLLGSVKSSCGRARIAVSSVDPPHGRSVLAANEARLCRHVRCDNEGRLCPHVRCDRPSSSAYPHLCMSASSVPAYPGAVADCIHFLKATSADL